MAKSDLTASPSSLQWRHGEPSSLPVIGAALNVSNAYPGAPTIDMLDSVMTGRQGRAVDLVESDVRRGSLAIPSSEFGQLVARVWIKGRLPPSGSPSQATGPTGCCAMPASASGVTRSSGRASSGTTASRCGASPDTRFRAQAGLGSLVVGVRV